MQTRILILLVTLSLGYISCDNEDNLGIFTDYVVATPLKMTLAEFKSGVSITAPVPLEESGKIYAYKDFVFVNDKYQGVHVIDNSSPNAPKKIAFINIPGNVDISIKDDFLYADSLMDLIVLDISDIHNITLANRMENVLSNYVPFSTEADFYDWKNVNYESEVVVGWKTKKERITKKEYENRMMWNRGFLLETNFSNMSAESSTTGQGGSLARFIIVNNYLYAVDSHMINIFNIQNLASPVDLEDVFAGFDIETIFSTGNHLFLGSRRGMYIYDISNQASPSFVSEFQHGTACDPVVVEGNYAYVTLRGGGFCGPEESGLYIVDISTITNPELVKMYPMDGPYGLGIKDDKIFVCDGESGLKVYDKTDVENLKLLNHFKNITTYDVIPLEETLLMVGEEILYQYQYLDNSIELISTLSLN